MRSFVEAALAALALSLAAPACGGPKAPAAPSPAAPPPADPKPSFVPALPENADATIWYAPPLPEARRPLSSPAIEDIRLPSGVRLLVLPRNDVPVVAVHTILRWAKPSPRIHSLFGQALLRGTPAGRSRPLRDELMLLGTQFGAWYSHDATMLGFGVTPQALDEALAAVFDGLKASSLTQEALDGAREEHLKALDTSPRAGMMRHIHEGLFPAGHGYREPDGGRPEDVKKLRADDLRAYGDAQLRPESISLCVVGDVIPSAVAKTVSKLVDAWKGSPRGAPSQPRAAPAAGAGKRAALKVARGVLVASAPEADLATVAVVLPVTPADTREDAAVKMAWWMISSSIKARLEGAAGPGKGLQDLWVSSTHHRAIDLYIALARMPAASAGAFVEGVLAETARVTKGDIPAESLSAARRAFADHLEERFDGARTSAYTLTQLAVNDERLDTAAFRHKAALDLQPDEIAKEASIVLTKQEARVVAMGDAAALKASLEPLKLGKVVDIGGGK